MRWYSVSRLLLFGTLAATLGCGSGGKLEGSVGNQYNIAFDYVYIAYQETAGNEYYIIEYKVDTQPDIAADPEVAEVTHDATLCPVEENVDYDFLVCDILDRTVVDGTEFDDVESGRIIFYQLGDIGSLIRGEFDVLFMNGLTLSGEFRGTLEERGGT